jgi:hypothetical protein
MLPIAAYRLVKYLSLGQLSTAEKAADSFKAKRWPLRDIEASSVNVKLAVQTNVQSDNPRYKKDILGRSPALQPNNIAIRKLYDAMTFNCFCFYYAFLDVI